MRAGARSDRAPAQEAGRRRHWRRGRSQDDRPRGQGDGVARRPPSPRRVRSPIRRSSRPTCSPTPDLRRAKARHADRNPDAGALADHDRGQDRAWLKKEGDEVKPGDVIAEIETDKATMEVEAVDEGRSGRILDSRRHRGRRGQHADRCCWPARRRKWPRVEAKPANPASAPERDAGPAPAPAVPQRATAAPSPSPAESRQPTPRPSIAAKPGP